MGLRSFGVFFFTCRRSWNDPPANTFKLRRKGSVVQQLSCYDLLCALSRPERDQLGEKFRKRGAPAGCWTSRVMSSFPVSTRSHEPRVSTRSLALSGW